MISKTTKIKQVQKALGTKPDGIIGAHTADVLYRQFASPTLPYEGTYFGCKVVIADRMKVSVLRTDNSKSVKDIPWSISGTFGWQGKPVSILVNSYRILQPYASHLFTLNKPETVLYISKDGTYGTQVARSTNDFRNGVCLVVGGGLIVKDGKPKFNAYDEGFSTVSSQDPSDWKGRYSDVKRYTAHCALGFDKFGNFLAVYHRKCTLKSFQQKLIYLGMTDGIFIDGGHISAMNAGVHKINMRQAQSSIIKLI